MPKKRVVLDSSVLIAAMDEGDVLHQDGVKVFQEILRHKASLQLLTPPLVIYETVAVLRRKGVTVPTLQNRIFKLTTLDFVTTIGLSEFSIFKHAGTILGPNSQARALRTNDLLISSLAMEFDAAIATFDEKLWRKCSSFYSETFFCTAKVTGVSNQLCDFITWM